MSLRLGDEAPDFTAQTTEGDIQFHDWLGESWGVLFSHPADFTPVCTTELGRAAALKPEFEKRNTRIIGLSVDPLDRHEGWSRDIAETQGTAVNFPMIADADRKVSLAYDMIHDRKVSLAYDMIHPNAEATATVRSVFIIGPDKKVKLTLTYPPSTGRNFDEILRVLDSLQLTAYSKVATPVDWKQGEDVVILPGVSNDQANDLFPGFRTIKPYLRMTSQPITEKAAARV
jgi:thioredoxin-dependent peroxiredoxin